MDGIRKNILDLEFQQSHQNFQTTLIIISTYIIGIVISILTKQLTYPFWIPLWAISLGIILCGILLLGHFKNEMRVIIKKIKSLEQKPI